MPQTMRLAPETNDKPRKLVRRINFSARTLDALPLPPDAKDVYVYDARQPGLAYRKLATGGGGFYFIGRIKGRMRRVLVGPPTIGIDVARDTVRKWIGQEADGVDPIKRRAEERVAGKTLGDLLNDFIENHGKLNKRTWQDDQKIIDRYVSEMWRKRQLKDIDRTAIKSLHRKIGRENGKYAANRLLALLSAAYNQDDHWQDRNPCRRVNRFAEESRERFLQADELPRFFEAVKAPDTDPLIADFVLLALFTGARRSNVQAMRWAEIDFQSATWTIPGRKSKNAKSMRIPLVTPAMEILQRRRESKRSSDEFVLASYGETGHLTDPKIGWADILRRAKIEDLHIHDLRRSLGSWMSIGNTSSSIVGAALGHQSTQSTAPYARLNRTPVGAAMSTAVDTMIQLANQKEQQPPPDNE